MNQLEQLKKYTKIVIDSGDIEKIEKYTPYDATTNPSLVLKAIQMKKYRSLLQESINYAKKKGGNRNKIITNATDKIIVSIGAEILKKIPGVVSSEVDSRLSFDTHKSIEKAKKLISLYETEFGISRSRILIKLAATWECIQAAKELEKENIRCNLTLLFSFAQARACAESKVFLISPFVGRISDWYNVNYSSSQYKSSLDPGVQSVQKIYKYYKKYSYKTVIMGASFRDIKQVLSLSGCDCLTISPELLEILQSKNTIIKQKLSTPKKIFPNHTDILSHSDFLWLHNQDSMAVEKLSQGIRQFGTDQYLLEEIVIKNM
ncbi:transaldolase [Buchnera aphidicola]|uniref:transaldolase n=1 Tax=Buchnera aphidicola TaxID=9 RepID=UPI00223842DE|nr:transaldolase [Buchnera aphidicola]MCW5197599.1 transaldolase [Buchnera aphidicola (Chaitophorus viminalis)]